MVKKKIPLNKGWIVLDQSTNRFCAHFGRDGWNFFLEVLSGSSYGLASVKVMAAKSLGAGVVFDLDYYEITIKQDDIVNVVSTQKIDGHADMYVYAKIIEHPYGGDFSQVVSDTVLCIKEGKQRLDLLKEVESECEAK